MTDARSPLRALRAALFAAICVAWSATGHAYTSGHDLSLTALLPAFGTTAAGAWLAGGRRRGALSIGTGLLTAQGALHLLFVRTQAQGRAHGPASGSAPDVHHDPAAGAEALSGGSALLGSSPAGMLAAHLLAAAVCALWLARGEAAFFRLARAAVALAFTPLRPPLTAVPLPPGPRPLVPPRPGTAPGLLSAVLGHTLVRRGPPALPAIRATAPGAAV
ncbi:hypothetical protein ACIBCM_01865 [Streptomyces sp. NPDC051018]|uniref:hypothetical protein n=1 Tax=Streptomyces sp. NPDC051018 TaxID=3365639 RepID=UPI0037ABCF5D